MSHLPRIGEVVIEQCADSFQGQIGRREVRQDLRILCIVSLGHEDGRDARLPDLLYRIQDSQLVIYNDVMLGWITLLDIRQFGFLVHIMRTLESQTSNRPER